MQNVEACVARVLRILGANVGVSVLAFVGLAVGTHFTGIPLFILIFVVSLLQGGMMVQAFGPVIGSETHLSLGGKIVGWVGFIAWGLAHLLNAEIVAMSSVVAGTYAVFVELLAYGIANTLLLLPFCISLVAPCRDNTKARSNASEQETLSNLEARDIARRQREEARVACELLYALREPDISSRFPRKRFQKFIDAYLTGDKSTEVVERRAAELQALIHQHYEAVNPPEQFRSLEEVASWYETQRQQIDNLDIEEIFKADYLVQLNERHDELMETVLRSLQ